MAEAQANRPRPPGTTSGSWERAPQALTGDVLVFDLAVEAAQVRTELSYQEGDRNADTLVKAPDFRIVLTALRPGTRVHEHQAGGRISIQTLSGRVRLHLPDQTVDLPAGHLLVLGPRIPHDVEALEASVFLLTLSGPASPAGA